MSDSLNIFISYVQEDVQFLNALERHLALLKYQGTVIAWSDQDVVAGNAWEQESEARLNSADIILLLISADFIFSKFKDGTEMVQVMKRHERGEVNVIPILLRPVDLYGVQFSKLRMLPANEIPVTKWYNQDEAFKAIVEGIRQVVKEIKTHRSSPLPPEKQTSVVVPEKQESLSYVAEFKRRMKELPLAKATVESVISPAYEPLPPETLFIYRGHKSAISAIEASPDGNFIASGDDSGLVQIWKPGTGQNILTAHGWGIYGTEKRRVQKICWSPDSMYLAVQIGNKDGSRVFIWHVATQRPLHCAGYKYLLYCTTSCFAWSPDSKYIAMDDKLPVPSFKLKIGLWKIETKEQVAQYEKHASENNAITAIGWAPNAKVIASADVEGMVHIWDLTGQTHFIYPEHATATNVNVCWSPDGKWLASSGGKGGLHIWSSDIGKRQKTYNFPEPIDWISWFSRGSVIACSGSSSGHRLSMWDSKTSEMCFSLSQKGFLSPDGTQLACFQEETHVQVYDIRTRIVRYTYRDHSSKVLLIAWSPYGRYIASGSADHQIHIWEVGGGGKSAFVDGG